MIIFDDNIALYQVIAEPTIEAIQHIMFLCIVWICFYLTKEQG